MPSGRSRTPRARPVEWPSMREERVLLHLDERTRRAIDPAAVYFLPIHRSHAVNLARVREVRLQADGRDWEVKLEPPVIRVLLIDRGELPALWRAFGEDS